MSDVAFAKYRWQKASISIEQDERLGGVSSAAFGWVAVGVKLNLPSAEPSPAPGTDPFADLYSGVVWTSPDGTTWTRHADGPEFDGSRISNVIGVGSGALAFGLGGVCLPDACSGLPPNGGTIVWSSSDGVTWERLADTGLANGATTDVAQADGALIAVGFVANHGSKPDDDPFTHPTDAAVWRSVDGRRWSAVTDLPIADRLTHVSAQGSQLVALGTSGTSTVFWNSTDGGLNWAEGPALDDDLDAMNRAIRGVVSVVATATDADVTDPETTTDVVVLTLDATGTAWTAVSPPKMHGYRPALAQVMGASFVIFGWTGHRDRDGILIADTTGAFTSLDGAVWTRATLPDEWSGQGPWAVAGNGRDLAAIVGPLDTGLGPIDPLIQTMWLGTAPD